MSLASAIFTFTILSFNTIFCQTKGEDFDEFIGRFIFDREFQVERIKFPLEYVYWNDIEDDSAKTKWVTKDKWEFDPLYGPLHEISQIYDNFKAELRDTDERVFAWEGVENGIDIKYYFKRINGKWYLIKKVDKSD